VGSVAAASPLLQGVITLITSSGIFALFTLRQSRRKLGAEADKAGVDATAVLTGEAMEMVREVRDQAKEARQQAMEARQEAAEARRQYLETSHRMEACERHVKRLEHMIQNLGGDPPRFVWRPVPDDG